MALDHGTGVSRTLSPQERAFAAVIWQKGKPPLDSELNLMSSVDWERFRQCVSASMPSGFFLDPTRAEFDFKFNPLWVNHFHLGVPRSARGEHDSDETQPVVWANVNGWIIPIAGTDIAQASGVHNVVKLYPPPESDIRVDFVFLEAWATLVQPNPSTTNKPTASTIWRFGNTKFGGTNITDDLEDPTIGIETTKRVQVQYRLRVHGSGVGQGSGVNLMSHPDGLDDPNILGQGAAASPVAGLQWANMREMLGDPSLWRAGNGDPNNDLGTIDGYTYAIPVCAVFRRNSGTYVAIKASGNPNQNGAFLRQPGAKLMPNPLAGAVVLLQATLGEFLGPDSGKLAAFDVAVTNLNGSGLDDAALVLSNTFLRIGDEIVGPLSAVNLNAGTITISAGGRGRWGTAATGHDSGTPLQFFNTRPDGLFADEIAAQDVLDLRRAVNAGDWDYSRLLAHNVAALAKGTLRTAWKTSNPGDTAGPVVHDVSDMYAANETHPNHTDPVDGPDGIRIIWSDAATIQPDVTLLLDHEATQDASGTVGFTTPTFDATVQWDVGADLKPIGFLNRGASGVPGWTNGSSIHLFIGGSTGEGGARGTFRASGVRDVRFVTPNEYWKSGYPVVNPENGNQHPVTLRFLGEKFCQAAPPGVSPTPYGGPLYPWREDRFERPFIVLGGLLHSTLRLTNVAAAKLGTQLDPLTGDTQYTIDLTSEGVNFNAAGTFYPVAGVTTDDPSAVSVPLLRGERTLFGMLTDHGKDRSGASSEVYLVLFGDKAGTNNNGAFRVIGAGTVGYTENSGTTSGMLVVEPLSADFSGWDATGNTVTVDFRSQYHNADDISNYQVASRQADLVVVLTDIGGEALSGTPWDLATVGALALPQDAGNDNKRTAESKAVLSLTLLYHPGRSATARVPDEFVRFAMQGGSNETIGTYLRRSPSSIDTTFSAVGTATDETYWDPIHVQTWNRLPARGWHAPVAPNYGGNVVGYTEQDREHECFVDRGSKTVLFRPFRNRDMTLKALTWSDMQAGQSLLGSYLYPDGFAKDSLHILTGTNGSEDTSGKRMGFILPQEFTPRFGRQDIPYRVLNAGAAPTANGFMPGINHLFTDVTDLSNPVFNIIGGTANAGGTEVNPLFFLTRASEVSYAHSNSSYGPNAVGVYGARKTTDIDPNSGQAAKDVIAALKAVNSSDLGRGLKGIQLPPFVGIARLYGVYEFEDYINKGGTAYKVNRYEMEAGSAVNLLREDADQQTLFILQDGAKDFTESVDDHTYIIPSNVLDLTRVPAAPGKHAGYVEGATAFEDFDYVVEATVFFFAHGFINKNTIVLCRKRSGTFALNTDGDDPEIENVKMCLPCPAGVNDHFYTAYNRTVYQGDPFMTRDGDSRQDADYENRYGRLAPSQAWLLRTAVQQFDSAGNFVPQMKNPRGFEVLASGKIGGALYPGTPLDVGFIDDRELNGLPETRMPLTETANDWRVAVRAFSEGQKANTSRARATLEILDNASLVNAHNLNDAFFIQVGLLDGTTQNLYAAVAGFRDNVLTQAPYNLPVEDIFEIDTTRLRQDMVYRRNHMNFGVLTPVRGDTTSTASFVPSPSTHPEADIPLDATVSVTVTALQDWKNEYGSVVFDGRFDPNTGNIVVRASWMGSVLPFNLPDVADDPTNLRNIREFAINFNNVPAGGSDTQTVAWTGLNPASVTGVLVTPRSLVAGLIATGEVTAPNTISITLHNHTAGDINPPLNNFDVTVFQDVDPTVVKVDLTDVDLIVDIGWEVGSKNVTADNLVACINAHSKLKRTITAFNDGTPKVTIEAVPVGGEGNGVHLSLGRAGFPGGGAGTPKPLHLAQTMKLAVPSSNIPPVGHQATATYLFGGEDIPVNAGNGTSQMNLTGMTERLPLGVLVQDSDFCCENPLGDTASAMNSAPASLRPIQTLMPLTMGGEEYSRFLGAPGELVGLADVQIAPYSWAAWTEEAPNGATRKYRIYRGGGAAFVLSGDNPGGPIDWVSESFPKASEPVLKSGVLACRAMLVRNFYEEALTSEGSPVCSQGDEIQLVVLTSATLGRGLSHEAITLDGIISPSGYGEGYAAADRYRCMGRPMVRGYSRFIPDPAAVTLAVYPEDQRGR